MKYTTKLLYIILIGILLGLFYFFQNAPLTSFILVFLYLFLFLLYDYFSKTDFKLIQYMLMFIILFLGIIANQYYHVFFYYDKVLHFVMPILGCFIAFYVVNKFRLSLHWKIFVTICVVSLFLGGLEIFEYLSDVWFGTTLQGVYSGNGTVLMSKIDDTIMDLIFDYFGLLAFTIIKIISTKIPKKS